ncbi:DUF3369 domain-containing protein [Thauera humireducens]|uniref:DUF3369 domain-containing protein n=1 Tax=Thauera humireducens TaxID=1134435 RepID=UPI003C740CBA
MRQGLESIVRASTELSKQQGMQRFAEGVVDQLCALLGVRAEGLVCAQGGLSSVGEPARVIAAAGRFRKYVLQPLAAPRHGGDPRRTDALPGRTTQSFAPALAIYFPTPAERRLAAYVELSGPCAKAIAICSKCSARAWRSGSRTCCCTTASSTRPTSTPCSASPTLTACSNTSQTPRWSPPAPPSPCSTSTIFRRSTTRSDTSSATQP